jgi:carbon starvation protein
MNDARFIGYGSMIGEASLSIATIIASVAGIALVTHCEVNGVFHEHLAWSDYYNSWENAAKNKFLAFVLGGGVLIEKLGLPAELSKTLISVLIISFAATTLDTATRIQRMIISELGKTIKSSTLNNKYIATLVGIIPAYYLTLNGTGWKLWPIFGASNQMLAALTLMILALYFYKKGKNILPLIIPMIFIVIITIIALFLKMSEFIQSKNYLLLSVSVILISLITWMLIEGVIQIRKRFTVNNY